MFLKANVILNGDTLGNTTDKARAYSHGILDSGGDSRDTEVLGFNTGK